MMATDSNPHFSPEVSVQTRTNVAPVVIIVIQTTTLHVLIILAVFHALAPQAMMGTEFLLRMAARPVQISMSADSVRVVPPQIL